MKQKISRECPTRCGHPNVFNYPNSKNIPSKVSTKINLIKGNDKVLLYCGHCNTLWVEFSLSDSSSKNVWYELVRVEDLSDHTEKWVI